jgi:5-methylcytosine-specific restriction protein A
MPSVPYYSKCHSLGCKNPKSRYNSFCMDHGGKDRYLLPAKNQFKRKETNDKYQTKQWRTMRQIQLSQHPLCAGCLAQGRIVQALHIDHIFPWTKLGEEAFYINLFQSLCHSCHSIKTALEQKGVFRRFGIPHRDYRIHDYQMVVITSKDEEPRS